MGAPTTPSRRNAGLPTIVERLSSLGSQQDQCQENVGLGRTGVGSVTGTSHSPTDTDLGPIGQLFPNSRPEPGRLQNPVTNLNETNRLGVHPHRTPSNTRSDTQADPSAIEEPISVAAKSQPTSSLAGQATVSDLSQSSSPPNLSDPDAYITTRFEYQQVEDGILIFTGRKGEFTACEDEPIRTPGAIQGFGVLMAVIVHGESRPTTRPHSRCDPYDPCNGISPSPSTPHSATQETDQAETEDSGRLEIVQVSENSRQILGLSPKLLLNLHSFTEVLTPDQSQQLHGNIEVCFDSESTSATGPHTFRLSGRGEIGTGTDGPSSYTEWSCWCAAHRPDPILRPRLMIVEFELENDELNPPLIISVDPVDADERGGLDGKPYEPTEQDLIESTTSINQPLRALARIRKKGKDFSGDSVEVLSIMSQLNNQFDKAEDMPTFLKTLVGLVRELTGFDRVMIYKFDESWNGQVVAELVDWKRTRDLYRGLRFPASDIPPQARELYKINKVRMLYDRDQPTARLMCKTQEELAQPLNMTHCHLRAMSPIHIKYLANVGVRSSFSISIIMNDELWGLISCHSYGRFGQRVTFPTRQFCTILGDSVCRNILRLNLSQRLQSRKLINTTSTPKNPSGYIIAKAEDFLWLFDAQSGVLSIGDEAKILGAVPNSEEILAILEYFRVKIFDTLQVSTDINQTFPDIDYPGGIESISGVLVIPLSRGGQDFICFFRPAESKEIHWAGNPYQKTHSKDDSSHSHNLEPRKSFKIWSETVKGRSKAWTDEQLETGAVVNLVYGKFIDVWRQKEAVILDTQLQALLLGNASHEVRTPLHQILSTLELALDGHLDKETRDNLSKSYSASKSLVHVINDLLDLAKTEHGRDLFSRNPFNLPLALEEAIPIYRREAKRKGLAFKMVESPLGSPRILEGDRARLRQVVSNLVGNAVKHTTEGHVRVQWGLVPEDEVVQHCAEDRPLGPDDIIRISIAVTDTGKGIAKAQLQNIFRAFKQGGPREPLYDRTSGSIGLGLAVVGRVVHNMGGQLKVDSTVNQGSTFTIILPFVVPKNHTSGANNSEDSAHINPIGWRSWRGNRIGAVSSSRGSQGSSCGSIGAFGSGVDRMMEALSFGSSVGSSSDDHYPLSSTSSFHRKSFSTRRRMSISSGSTASTKGNGSIYSLRSNTGAQMSHRRISSAPNHTLYNEQPSRSRHHPEAQRKLVQLAPPPSDGPSKPEGMITPKEDVLSEEMTRPEAVEPLQQTPTDRSINRKNSKKDEKTVSSKLERPTIPATNEAGQPGQSTLTLDNLLSHGVQEANKSSPFGPSNHLQHISDYQKPTHNRLVAQQPMRVMVVEDDPINRMILKKRLTSSGHSVSLTVHGQDAFELFERDPSQHDIILMDLQMPICDGMQATRMIRAFEKASSNRLAKTDYQKDDDGENKKKEHYSQATEEEDKTATRHSPKSHLINLGVPIIAVSASLHERQLHEILEAGMDGWIPKPVDFTRLATMMIASLDLSTRAELIYQPGTWHQGGWLCLPENSARYLERSM
ncbi:hypothetical protein Pst134EA_030476 [Puccinia striiformis f. sp. tritici]|uniref:hypothetical protein n=1 Tax=Puccinia striiformis f. sp. tritici TaxID=168172 RepID=UPI002007C313|nr:hypothetical protein Pst134EA_030476 [Puccinia striiformis f. sp. tritici]KAH9446563.1 hypothetical protein Pst134EA_030476 [Puccinia striiformis f. sp. tritici]